MSDSNSPDHPRSVGPVASWDSMHPAVTKITPPTEQSLPAQPGSAMEKRGLMDSLKKVAARLGLVHDSTKRDEIMNTEEVGGVKQ